VNRRLLVLIVLLAATLFYWSFHVYYLFSPAATIFAMTGFSGAVRDGRFVVTEVGETDYFGEPTRWYLAGVKVGDRVVGLFNPRGQGGRIGSFSDFAAAIKTIRFREPWVLEVERAVNGRPEILRLTVPALSPQEIGLRARFLLVVSGLILPVIAIVAAFFIGLLKPEDNNAFLAGLLFLSFSTLFTSYHILFPPGVREFGLIYQVTLNEFLIYLFMLFFLLFPSPSILDRKLPWLKKVFFATTSFFWLLLLALAVAQYHSFEALPFLNDIAAGTAPVYRTLALVMFLIGLASLVLNTLRAQTKDEKRRMVILLTGTLVGLVPLASFLVFFSLSGGTVSWWAFALILVSIGVFPLSFVYVVIKHRVLGLRVILRRGVQYALVSRGFLIIEGLLLFVLFLLATGPLHMGLMPQASPTHIAVVSAFVVVALLAGLREVNRRVMPMIDRRFFREAYDTRILLTDLSHDVRRLATRPAHLIRVVSEKIFEAFHPDQVAVFLRRSEMEGLPPANQTEGRRYRRNAGGGDDFQCYFYQVRKEFQEGTALAQEPCGGVGLPAGSFVASGLERAVGRGEAALDVYLDNPKSWVRPLARAQAESDRLYAERRLLERLHCRLLVPLVVENKILGFVSLGEKLSEEPYTREDRRLVYAVAEQMAGALDYSHLTRMAAEQETLKREIQIAKEVQSNLFPQSLPPVQGLDYAGICRPARDVGGDYYDFLLLGPEKLGVALGDISGKGISAALLMANLQATLRSQAPLRGEDLKVLLGDINNLLCRSTDARKFATFFYGVYDATCRSLTYVNAGHNLPILFKGKTGGRVVRLATGGMILGAFKDSRYMQETLQLDSGDVLVVFSDGITEAANEREEYFDEERLVRIVVRNRHLEAAGLCDRILAEVAAFTENSPPQDDMTLVAVRVL
jgi:sigma-B regulation protein RsbU (phosphoserine phosphatase)